MVKKYRLIPEKEYMLWKNHVENNQEVEVNSILDSKLPDDVKIKLFQDQKRIECNERDRADMVLRMGASITPKVVKDVEVQHEEKILKDSSCSTEVEQSPIPTPPSLPPSPKRSSITSVVESRKRKEPPVDITRTTEFQRRNMKRVARFLSDCGINGNDKGQLFINKILLPGADYVSTIRQLTDARMKRCTSTLRVMKELQKFEIPADVFSATIMNAIQNTHVNNDQNMSVKWDEF